MPFRLKRCCDESQKSIAGSFTQPGVVWVLVTFFLFGIEQRYFSLAWSGSNFVGDEYLQFLLWLKSWYFYSGHHFSLITYHAHSYPNPSSRIPRRKGGETPTESAQLHIVPFRRKRRLTAGEVRDQRRGGAPEWRKWRQGRETTEVAIVPYGMEFEAKKEKFRSEVKEIRDGERKKRNSH